MRHHSSGHVIARNPQEMATVARALLVVITVAGLLASVGPASARSPAAPGVVQSPGVAGVPPILVGTWSIVAASGSQDCDDFGQCTTYFGGTETFTFRADGQFEYSQYLASSIIGCNEVTFLDVTGTVTTTRTSLTLFPEHATNSKQDSCGEDTIEEITIDPTTYDWRVATAEDGHPQLYVSNAAGETGPLDPRDS
jgi:hypothetical protein